MEIKVRHIDSSEPKSIQQVEEQLLKQHEEQLENVEDGEVPEVNKEDEVEVEVEIKKEEPQVDELTDESVLSYIKKRYNKNINSFDELIAERKEAEPLPEDVATFLKFKKETGRGFEDFVKFNKDYSNIPEEQLIREHLSIIHPELDNEDIDVLMEEYSINEDVDEESDIKKKRIIRKKAIADAKSYFDKEKEKYKLPIVSVENGLSPDERKEYESYRQYIEHAKTNEAENERKRQWFHQKTNELFSKDFKGFEFSVGDKKIVYSPGGALELKKAQSNPLNFISKYLDDQGLIQDVVGYHKSLAIAMNPEAFAKFFYEQGQADAIDKEMRTIKNVNMTERRATEVINKGNVQVRAVSPEHGNGLKISSKKK